MTEVDVAVVGRGMIGSAAARHLAEAGRSTALIGPGEPDDYATSDGPFCSHPDQGRITRIAADDPTWATVAARSIARYREIAIRSGISFHSPVGLALATPDLDDWIDAGLVHGSNIRRIDADQLRASTGIAVDNGHPVGFEQAPAGYLNPRRLVAAQTRLASAADATVIADAVDELRSVDGRFELVTRSGSVTAERVLLATGAFGWELLERPLALERRPRTVVTAEMADDATIPSLILREPPDDRLATIYWVPPIPFPDGRTCLKIGGSLAEPPSVAANDDLIDWFRGEGNVLEIEALQNSLRSLLPDAEFASFGASPCVTTETPTGLPYIGFVDDGLAVAIGGNGSAAKSSDELGRLAAGLFDPDGWTDSLDPDHFTPRFAD